MITKSDVFNRSLWSVMFFGCIFTGYLLILINPVNIRDIRGKFGIF